MPKTDNPYPEWPGFAMPSYTPIPDELFDLWLPHLSGAEVKVLLYICRRTFGWKKEADAISLQQITGGIRRRDGTALDYGTGLAQASVVTAIQGLVAKGLIVAQRQQRPDGGKGTNVYTPRMREPITNNWSRGAAPITNNQSRATSENGDPLPQELDIQETLVQDTENKRGGEDASSLPENPPAAPPPYSPVIAGAVLDLARTLRDELAGPGAVTQALRLWQQSGLSEAQFVAALQATQGRSRKLAAVLAALTKQTGETRSDR